MKKLIDRFFAYWPIVGFAILLPVLAASQTVVVPKLSNNTAYARVITAGGTTGARTINTPAGSVNFAAAATTLVVTNSLANATSIIFLAPMTNDTTCKSFVAVRAVGSFTITSNAACAAETVVGFLVTN